MFTIHSFLKQKKKKNTCNNLKIVKVLKGGAYKVCQRYMYMDLILSFCPFTEL